MIKLTERHRETLRKMFHGEVRKASPLMSKLLGDPLLLSVPGMSFLTSDQAAHHLEATGARLHSIQQSFRGALHGEVIFVFPGTQSLEIVRKAGSTHVEESALSSMEQDVITVVGHIVLNACTSSLAHGLGRELACEALHLKVGEGRSILSGTNPNHWAMFLRIRFTFDDTQIEGFVVFILSTNSFDALRAAADRVAGQLPIPSQPGVTSGVA